MAAAQVPGYRAVFARRMEGKQDQLQVGGDERVADRTQHAGEERVGEDLYALFAHHEGDRAGPAWLRCPRGTVTDVTEPGHRRLYPISGLRTHLGRTGENPRCRG